jgi:hypothetical protein
MFIAPLFLYCCQAQLQEEDSDPWQYNPASAASMQTQNLNVARIIFIPEVRCQGGTCLDERKTGRVYFPQADQQIPVSAVQNRVEEHTRVIARSLTEGSRFRGQGQPAIQYNITQTRLFNHLPINAAAQRPDYRRILTDVNVCDWVDRQGIRQIWMWSWHYDANNPGSYTGPLDVNKAVNPAESNMAMGRRSRALFNRGSYGDVSNSEQTDDLPICENTYTVFNYTYQSEIPGNPIHNHMHQLESLFSLGNHNLFWNSFGGKQYFDEPRAWGCGNAHWAPNSMVKSDEYRYDLGRSSRAACENWDPDGFSIATDVSCSKWGCNDIGYYVWFMQRLPGFANPLSYQGRYLRNWWSAVADFDGFFSQGRDLVSSYAAPPKNCGSFRLYGMLPDRCR